MDGVAAVAGRVGKELAPHVKKHGSKLVPESLKSSKDGCSKMDGAKLVAGSSIQGNGINHLNVLLKGFLPFCFRPAE